VNITNFIIAELTKPNIKITKVIHKTKPNQNTKNKKMEVSKLIPFSSQCGVRLKTSTYVSLSASMSRANTKTTRTTMKQHRISCIFLSNNN